MGGAPGRMAFVPEGQLDSSQARNAWSHEENSSVPAGRLNGYRLALKASEQEYLAFSVAARAQFRRQISLAPPITSTVPPGRGLFASLSRHFVPGYYHAVPPGQNNTCDFYGWFGFYLRRRTLITQPVAKFAELLECSNVSFRLKNTRPLCHGR